MESLGSHPIGSGVQRSDTPFSSMTAARLSTEAGVGADFEF